MTHPKFATDNGMNMAGTSKPHGAVDDWAALQNELDGRNKVRHERLLKRSEEDRVITCWDVAADLPAPGQQTRPCAPTSLQAEPRLLPPCRPRFFMPKAD